jgi:hypothetical protein
MGTVYACRYAWSSTSGRLPAGYLVVSAHIAEYLLVGVRVHVLVPTSITAGSARHRDGSARQVAGWLEVGAVTVPAVPAEPATSQARA